ncbi:P1 family peptidase [Candidatus Bipolaricaulota bacterium]|nr:P1 family peptidase [Candidatus Bipolaricaulota bacterium]
MSFVLREHGIQIGRMEPGATNSITDVDGVMVGHSTIIEGESVRTGVTAIVPHSGNLFYEKVKASVVTINGFGKAVGLPQINELGTIETPILLTNTLSVGKVSDTLISWVLEHYQLSDCPIVSINPVVAECNDSYLNDIRERYVEEEHIFHALDSASQDPVEEGAVGAGAGVSAFEFKSGIGSASRIVCLGREDYTIGVFSLPNFGRREELVIKGVPIGIARTGGMWHNGSGEFVIAFTTANKVPHDSKQVFLDERRLNDAHSAINTVFQAVIEAVEESIFAALFAAKSLAGRDGHRRVSIPTPQALSILKARGVLST